MSVYVPFWVVLNYLDSAKYDPFIKCAILKSYRVPIMTDDGEQMIAVVDLEIKPNLIAEAVPDRYLIQDDELQDWANKIGNWIKNFPNTL